ncbi:MAG: glycosyltransferase family 39 protein, partial [Oceanospirillaceae bacterium]|nr:glycosyltransferase family 39 protein [Oceanospirillaceae bacterium]
MTATHSYNRTLLVALGVHCLLWFLLPSLLQPNANLDVVEGLTWGQEWQLGYDKHPLLAPWLTYAITLLSPASNWPIFLLSQIAVLTAFWAQYSVGRTFLGKQPALVAVLLLTLVPYYNYLTPEFNPNILQLAIWALTVLFGFRAINHNRLWDWLMLGVCSGLAMLTKYYSVVLLLSIACYFLTPAGRPFWRQKGIYVALIATVLVWLPNLIWLIEHDFSTIRYGAARGSGNEKALADHLINPLRFGVSQLAALIILLPTFFLLIRAGSKQSPPAETHLAANRTFLTLIAFGPLIITLLISLATGMRLRSMWGTPLFTFLPLWLMVFSGTLLTEVRMKKLIRVWVVTSL